MKQIAKYLPLACVAIATGLFAISCSSDEVIEGEKTSESENVESVSDSKYPLCDITVYQGNETEKLSSRAAKMEGMLTRTTLTDYGGNIGLVAGWKTTDVLKFVNITRANDSAETINEHETLAPTTAGQSSPLKGRIKGLAGHQISVFYPHINGKSVTEKGFIDFKLDITDQHGTLTDIAENHDFLYGVAELIRDHNDTTKLSATLKEMNSLMSICQFNFPKASEIGNITKVTIDNLNSVVNMNLDTQQDTDFENMVDGETKAQITITPESGKSYFDNNSLYIAFFPGEEIPQITIYTDNNKKYVKTYSKFNIKRGKIYRLNVKSVTEESRGDLMITEFYTGVSSDAKEQASHWNTIELYNCGTKDLTSDDLAHYSLRVLHQDGTKSDVYQLDTKFEDLNPVVEYGIDAATETNTQYQYDYSREPCAALLCFRDGVASSSIYTGTTYAGYTIEGASIASNCINGVGIIQEAITGDSIVLMKDGDVIDKVIVPEANHSTFRNEDVLSPRADYLDSEWSDWNVKGKDPYWHTLGCRPLQVTYHHGVHNS